MREYFFGCFLVFRIAIGILDCDSAQIRHTTEFLHIFEFYANLFQINHKFISGPVLIKWRQTILRELPQGRSFNAFKLLCPEVKLSTPELIALGVFFLFV